MTEPLSLQLIGSIGIGGAEHWFGRFARALAETGGRAELAIRAGSALANLDLGSLPLHPLPLRTVWDPLSRLAVRRLIARVQPDIVQTYMGRATRLTHIKRGRVPVHVARLGGYFALHPYRHAHAWIGNTRGLCDWLIRQGLPAGRVHHIYNFVDQARPVTNGRIQALRAELGLPADAWVLVSAGRFAPVKGLGYLVAAMAQLPATIADRPPHLVLLGEGHLDAELRSQAESLGLGERIHWAGWRNETGPFFQMADLIVFPSLEEETLGNVILEAWGWSKPLVTTRFRGAREITRHGEDAWCLPCGDAHALAEGIEVVLTDDALRQALARQGQARVQAEFSRATVMAQYRELYRQLAGG
ncbi:MAG: glycosyltransferase [Chromatiaceae bacterium]